MQIKRRFEAVMEPTNTWLVWDNIRNLPAEAGSGTLIGLSRKQALAYSCVLNDDVKGHFGQSATLLTQKIADI